MGVALQQVDNLKYFLISAPVDWTPDQYIRRFLLPTGEYVSCVLWNNLFHISGTDIVRCLSFRFQAFGRPVKNPKKIRGGNFLRSAESQVRDRRVVGRTQESFPGLLVQE